MIEIMRSLLVFQKFINYPHYPDSSINLIAALYEDLTQSTIIVVAIGYKNMKGSRV